MSLSEIEIASAVEEITALEKHFLERAWSPRKRVVYLKLRKSGSSQVLFITAEPPFTRLHIGAKPKTFGVSDSFQAGLRSELEGLRLESISQINNDRIVEFYFIGRAQRYLVAELMGSRGNLLILDEEKRILHVARQSSAPKKKSTSKTDSGEPDNKSGMEDDGGKRILRPGRLYYLPKKLQGSSFEKTLTDRFRTQESQAGEESFPVSRAIEDHYSPLEAQRSFELHKKAVIGRLQSELKKTKKNLQKLHAEHEKSKDRDLYIKYGELLKVSLNTFRKGDSRVEVVDWYEGGQPLSIPLSQELGPRENMERFFRIAGKLASAEVKTAERINILKDRQQKLELLFGKISEAFDGLSLDKILESPEGRKFASGEAERYTADDKVFKKGGKNRTERKPYRIYRSLTGRPILVGRGSSDNDALSFRVARGNDIWIHARGHRGSHVVVPIRGYGEPDQETMLDAATLAAHFSKARGETLVDIAWTQRKHVRKPKGAPPGLVTVTGEKGILLRFDKARLDRLIASDN